MQWKDIVGDIAKFAPVAGTIVGGPAGAAVGMVGSLIAHALGVDATPDAVQSAIATDPQAALKLRELELNNAVQLQQLAITQEQNRLAAETATYQAEIADRDSARKREEAVKDWTPSVMAYLVTLGFFSVLGFLLYYGKPAAGGDALLVMLGALGTAWTAIISYYYGSSKGSDRKTELLASSVPAKG